MISEAAAYTYDLYEHEAKQLPEHYVERCKDFHRRDPKPIHFMAKEGKWEYQTNSKNIIPIQNVHIPLIFPEEANEGLWGGEGVIEGYRKSHKRFTFKIPKMWKPLLMTRALYSEILDQWFSVTVTFHTLDQIDEAKGFDFYILKTHERDINSRLGMVFRRKMLLALSNKDFYHDDPKKRSRVFRKYVKYLIPVSNFYRYFSSLNMLYISFHKWNKVISYFS
ncbi:hypothetical protein FSP39_003618 [Pinctada imbricata]|uniref:Large ribosomal subunit protein bL28m n=1 Tax=Pinctada imbricata TaxID=66713 RepID=A0AA89C4S7_PINIB|nr:hypothetical protein FSP39_003618 [Pinctada imbricata]